MATRSLGLRYANYESGARGKVDVDAKLDMTVLDLKKIALDKWPEDHKPVPETVSQVRLFLHPKDDLKQDGTKLSATSLSPDSGVQLHTHGDKVWILVNLDVNAVPDKKGGTMGAGGAAAGGDAGCCVIS